MLIKTKRNQQDHASYQNQYTFASRFVILQRIVKNVMSCSLRNLASLNNRYFWPVIFKCPELWYTGQTRITLKYDYDMSFYWNTIDCFSCITNSPLAHINIKGVIYSKSFYGVSNYDIIVIIVIAFHTIFHANYDCRQMYVIALFHNHRIFRIFLYQYPSNVGTVMKLLDLFLSFIRTFIKCLSFDALP